MNLDTAQTIPERAEAIAKHCDQARQTGKGWQACCPAHEDSNPSLTISPENDKVLLYCHAGCTYDAIVTALGLESADLSLRVPTRNGRKRIVKVYPYLDVNGHVLHETVRYQPKDFKQRRPDPARTGEYLWTLKGITPVLYHLLDVLAAVQRRETIYLCEGEKDADNVQALRLTATCNALGAGKWEARYTETLRGADVVMLPHNDMPGRKHGEVVATSLHGIAASVKVIELPGLPNHGDISDWLAAGGTRAALEAMVNAAPLWTPPAAQTLAVPLQVSSNGHSPAEADPSLGWNDYVNALHLVREHGQGLRYCYPWKRWLVWTGSHWQHDSSGNVMRAAKATIKRLAQRVQNLPDVEAKALLRHIKESLATSKLKAMVESAQSEPDIPVQPEALDTHGWLLNCANGTIDLRTGTLQTHQQANLLTKCLSIPYKPSALCPTWHAFLWRIFGGTTPDTSGMSTNELEARHTADDPVRQLIAFLQRALGYALTGSTREQCLFILYGTGANGKSTLLEMLQTLLDAYAQSTPSASLLAKDRHGHEGINNDIARLRGARLVTAVEIGEGKRLNEELVKRLTGGDTLTARFLHAEFFDFVPEFKLFIACNHLPQIRGTDHAIWRRVYLVPFTVTIPKEEQDSDLPAKLRKELPGILAWLVQGCLAWQKDGLQPPEEVIAATQDYRQSMDVFEGFLTDECFRDPTATATAGDLYTAYERWCTANDLDALSKRTFGIRLAESGFTPTQGTGGRRIWRGIGLPWAGKEDKRSGT